MELIQCHATWADELGHSDSTDTHHCKEDLGFHARRLSITGGNLIHICSCGAEMWDEA